MTDHTNIALVQRFIRLPQAQRRAFLDKLQSKGMSLRQLPVPPCQVAGERLPLSYAQQRQWFLWQLEPDSTAYHIPMSIRLRGELDVAALAGSIGALIARHESLRTGFEQDVDGQACQVVHPPQPWPLSVEPFGALTEHSQARLEQLMDAEVRQPFDLARPPLLRVRLLQLEEQDHVVLLTLHHIVSDAVSMQIMVQELIGLYDAHRQGRTADLASLPIQYADYAIWQRTWMEAGERERQLAYWTGQLGHEASVLQLPLDHPRPVLQSFRGARLPLALAPQLSEALLALAKREGVTPFMLLLASFQVLMHRYSGQANIRVGVPVANRNREEIAGLIGFFVNTQVYSANLEALQPFNAFVQQVKETALAAQAHQDLPFEQLVDALQPERNLSHAPLFQVMFNHQSETQVRNGQRLAGISVEGLHREQPTAQFDLVLNTVETAEGLQATLTYATDLFDAATVESMGGHWQQLLEAIATDATLAVGELPLLCNTQHQASIAAGHAEPVELGPWQPVQAHIGQQALCTPEHIAVRQGAQSLTYRQLEQKAEALAAHLQGQGVGPDVAVAVLLAPSMDRAVAMLAVLKAGGAYVPLDPGLPDERLQFMLADSGVRCVLVDGQTTQRVPGGLAQIDLERFDYAPATCQPVTLAPDNLVYIIYTSGSTGQPKGVCVRHGGLSNHMAWMQGYLRLGADDRVLQKTVVGFDASVWEFWLPLMSGAQLVMASAALSDDLSLLWDEVATQQISVLQMAPSLLQGLMPAVGDARLASLRTLLCGGEALPQALIEQWQARSRSQVINLYGPTEATIDTCALRIDQVPQTAVAALGQPIANVHAHVLEATLKPAPAGVPGELLLGGQALARGYLNRPGLTAERFVPDPYGEPGARLYRTGDLCRRDREQNLHYLGRLDHQVKIRGLRIELGEIEAMLRGYAEVAEAVVLPIGDGPGAQLAAYLVGRDGALDGDAALQPLRRDLEGRLPAYMVPVHWICLPALPLTRNGKLDRRALPQPQALAAHVEPVAPGNALEERLVALWCDVLKRDTVGVHDNFFELGGDSIVSIQLVSRARQGGIHFTPKALFLHQTVARLAQVAQWQDGTQAVRREPWVGSAALLPAQQRFFESVTQARHHWNQSVLLQATSVLDPVRLGQALQYLVNEHEALRVRFVEGDEGWMAHCMPADGEVLLERIAVADEQGIEPHAQRLQASLDLANGTLMRAALFELGNGDQRLLLIIHHLVVDGVSWRVLFEDLQRLYGQLQAGQTLALPAPTSSLRDWAERLQAFAREPERIQELAYWEAQGQDVPNDLPGRRCDGPLLHRDVDTVQTRLDSETTRRLLQEAPAAYRTQVNDLLLAALVRVLARWTGHDAQLVQMEGHGREDLFEGIDLTRTVGWFTSLYPLRLQSDADLGRCIKQVKEQLRSVPAKGVGHGVLLGYAEPQVRERLAAQPTPRVSFNYLGQFDGSFTDEQALLRPCAGDKGSDQSELAPLENWLSINGRVFEGELSLGWSYSRKMFDTPTLQRLAQEYAEELRQLVAYCTEPGNGGLTPSDLPLAGLAQAQIDHLLTSPRSVQDAYPLSPMQQGMLFHSAFEVGAGHYINQMRVDVTGLDVERFRQAWQGAMDAHDILRSRFIWQDALGQPMQVVLKAQPVPFDVRPTSDAKALQAIADEQRQRGFDLAEAPGLRLVLVPVDGQTWHLIYTSHHVLMDGWSTSQLFGEVLQRYAGQPIEAMGSRFSDYIGWLATRDAGATQRFWEGALAPLQAPSLLADSLPRPGQGAGHGNVTLALEARATERLSSFARENKVTVNTLVQAGWLLLLQKYTGQATVTFGATVAGRPPELPGIERQIGLFINTLAVVASPRPEQSVQQWLQAVQDHNLALREYEHAPLYQVQQWAGRAGQALFDTLLVFENYPVSEALQRGAPGQLRFGPIDNHEQTHFPLSVTIGMSDRLVVHMSYARECFGETTVERLCEQLLGLLTAMAQAPEAALGELPLLGEAEQRQAAAFNATTTPYDLTQTVHGLFEQQVQANPDAPALLFGEQQLSYAELNARANRLAHQLIAAGVGEDVLVGVAAERSLELVVGLLAVLKAGGAYVPLDPDYPAERLAYLFEDSGVSLLLTQPHLALQVPPQVQVLALDAALDAQPSHDPQVPVAAEALAYVIYTSGSTGRPKGAGNRHSALTNRLQWMQQAYGLGNEDTVLQKTPFSFDVSVWEFFWPLMTGARLLLAAPGEHRDPARLVALIERHRVSTLHFVPSMLQVFLQDAGVERCRSLRRIICSGEALQEQTQQHVFARLPWAGLYNLYGPTEAAIDVTHWRCRDEGLDLVPIGQPIANLRTYVLDSGLQPVPVGVLGELYLAGAGLARGYHRRPGLTAERFPADPFVAGERMYRTGDLARYRADGTLEYGGRIDHQVKLRGLRIELGEIEARLLEQAQVREAAVLVVEQQLVAYVVGEATADALKAQLARSLPEYMVPAQW
ncbi:MAG TPA: amino acid adenylation domain-containing protein, partial [Pseudomonas sp.]|nr:amino acid adenylation domain-containing protein [Pseudomonas sp.]